jgi:hypothetical protein
MSKKRNMRLVLLSLLVILSILLTSCGAAEDTQPPPSDQPTEQVSDGEPTAEQPTDGEQPTAEQPTDGQPSSGAGVVDTGFRPEVNGFSYQNYGDVAQTPDGQQFTVVNLTSVEMRRLFGDGVCAATPKADNSCALTPPAEQWMTQNNASMNGGHCEGFAVFSQMAYLGQVDPNTFGAGRVVDLQIKDNEPLQREIAYWFSTQGPTWGQQQVLTPKEMVEYLISEYTKNPKSVFRLGIMKEDGTGGHAITAYEVKDQGNGVYWVMVYDNNYPGKERQMVVDTNANTSEYDASINPSVAPDTYKGTETNKIFVAPNELRLTTFPCDFCTGGTGGNKGGSIRAADAPGFNELWTEGYVNVELEDDQGRKVGYDKDGKFVNEISDAKVQPVMNGTLSEVPPVIKMPTGLGFTAYIYGDDKAADEPASLVMIGKGFYIGVDNIVMAPDQLDQLAFDAEGDFLTYTTDSQESPDIVVGIEKAKADFELDLKAVKVSKGTDIHVLFDQKEDTFAFQTTSDAPAQFSISITRIDENGEEETFDTGSDLLDVDPGKLMYFYFGKWEGQGSNLEVGYDADGNGTIEDSEITNMADAQ